MKIKNKKTIKKIGLLGGSFDPSHEGHLAISIKAKRKFKLDHIIWAITKKNPFKKKSSLGLKERIKLSKKITKFKKFIKIRYYEDKIKSGRTINLINYIKRKNNCNIFLIFFLFFIFNFIS